MSRTVKTPIVRTALVALLMAALGLQFVIATVHAASLAASRSGPNDGANLSTIIICTVYGPRPVRIGTDGLPADDDRPLPSDRACPICGNLLHNVLPSPAGSVVAPTRAYYLPASPFCRTLPPPRTTARLRPQGRAPPLTV